MNLQNLTNTQLVNLGKQKAAQERQMTLDVIKIISEVEKRKLFLPMAYSSLFDFVTKEFGFEESAALRRIQAARLLKEVPEIQEKVIECKLSLTNLSMAQRFFNKEEKLKGKKLQASEKKEVLELLEHKSTREAEKVLVTLSPDAAPAKFESVRFFNKDEAQVKLVMSKELIEKLNQIRFLKSHKYPNMSYVEILEDLATKEIEKYKKVGRVRESDLKIVNLPAAPQVKRAKPPSKNQNPAFIQISDI